MRRLLLASLLLSACAHYDVVIRNGTIYDGSGGAPVTGDVAIRNDRIARIGNVGGSAKAGGKSAQFSNGKLRGETINFSITDASNARRALSAGAVHPG